MTNLLEKQIHSRVNKEIITWMILDLAAITFGLIEITNPQSNFCATFFTAMVVIISSGELINNIRLKKNIPQILAAIEQERLSQQNLNTTGPIIESQSPKTPKR